VTANQPLVTVVPALMAGMRVDRAVAMLTGLSRSAAADLISRGRVEVDRRLLRSRSEPLAAGQELVVHLPLRVDQPLVPDPGVPFTVVHEDEVVVVVDKPAGVVVHPGAGRPEGTLAAGLLARYPDLAAVGDPIRPGIVHRIDRGTSGLLVVARTEKARQSLGEQLRSRTVERQYLALAAGCLIEDRGVIEAPIGRSARTPTRMTVSAQGRRARTTYKVLARIDRPLPSSLLLMTLETGRTHQIRVHLSAIGHPVVGEDRYCGHAAGRVGGSILPPGRLFLHAAVLGFEHPSSGERVRWSSPLPPDLAAITGAAAVPD
jgi:23S rRNA pseudouridine1911/1915/1917 synthase